MSTPIFSSPYAAAFGAGVFLYFVVYPVVTYFRDLNDQWTFLHHPAYTSSWHTAGMQISDCLRRYPSFHSFAGFSNIPFMILAHTGARSTFLEKLHRKTSMAITYEHARKRKTLSSAYAIKNLEGWEHKVADKTQRLIKHIDTCCTAPLAPGGLPESEDVNLDYRKWINFFTLDAIADIGLSEKLRFLDQGTSTATGRKTDGTTYQCDLRPALYQTARKQSLPIWSYERYSIINKIVNIIPFYRRMDNYAKEWDGISNELAWRRLQRYRAGEKSDDFFQALMEDKNGSPNNLEWGEIVAEVSIMLNAGSATTAIAIANATLQLIKHPECLKELREELDAALEDSEDIDESGVIAYDSVKHLPYLRACLDESLRLFTPTPHGLPRETPADGANILGDCISGGISVAMSAHVAHRQDSVFPRADQYIPERWLGEEGKTLQPYFLSFSAGARGCIGRNISYLEQTVVLASLLRRYEFVLKTPDWNIERLETMNWILGEVPVKVWRRERKSEIGA
ncbi:benzoate 4-monooxygenase cytochrome P450 [Didymella exigua CBS 183.55]|uniref:Benzoate 4-monooxygenase cytochrome P450 n=1 Tax=Didymella exigua CBS 183.55 TaxID=1150837 RepID=A0A6A5RRS9_9PLEO|nr:benzoate 4-monooxygenase cytochrome P450 [Didymella exigua CBS 183.55]KAF1929764.1 benzoate 4-monooxygenase cytochrome P450 [Didymella exigua CBS 183.55]